MIMFTRFIPGFRSKTTWKIILASVYYIFSFIMLFEGIGYGLFMLSMPFMILNLIEMIHARKKGIPLKKSGISFIASLAVFVLSISITPTGLQNQPPEQNNLNKTETRNTPAQAAPSPSEDNSTIPGNREEGFTEQANIPINLEKAELTRCVDGDTVYVRIENNEEQKLRLIGVDTPETVHPEKQVEFYGKEASDFTKSNLSGKNLYLEKDVSHTDRYDRLLRYVWLEAPTEISESEIRSKMFNAILILDGYGQVSTFPPDVKYSEYFVKFQDEARNNKRGLWADNAVNQEPAPTEPPGAKEPGTPAEAISQTYLTSPVKQGQNATITIQGKAGVKYSIKVTYKSGASTAEGLEPKTAGNDGKITWTWKVGSKTTPGQYPVTISGGGQTFQTYLSITK